MTYQTHVSRQTLRQTLRPQHGGMCVNILQGHEPTTDVAAACSEAKNTLMETLPRATQDSVVAYHEAKSIETDPGLLSVIVDTVSKVITDTFQNLPPVKTSRKRRAPEDDGGTTRPSAQRRSSQNTRPQHLSPLAPRPARRRSNRKLKVSEDNHARTPDRFSIPPTTRRIFHNLSSPPSFSNQTPSTISSEDLPSTPSQSVGAPAQLDATSFDHQITGMQPVETYRSLNGGHSQPISQNQFGALHPWPQDQASSDTRALGYNEQPDFTYMVTNAHMPAPVLECGTWPRPEAQFAYPQVPIQEPQGPFEHYVHNAQNGPWNHMDAQDQWNARMYHNGSRGYGYQ